MDVAVAQDLVRRGEKLVHIRHLSGSEFACIYPYNETFWKACSEIPSMQAVYDPDPSGFRKKGIFKYYKFHRLDMLLLDALCGRYGYALRMDQGAQDAMRKLTADYRLRLEVKKSDFAGWLEVPCKRPLDRLQNIGANCLAVCRYELLADDPGSGKTAQVIGAILLNKVQGRPYRTLVVGPTSAKGVWDNEVKLMTDDLKAIMLDSDMNKRYEQWDLLSDYDMVISGYSSFIEDYAEIVKHFKPDIIVFDEAHRLCEKDNQTTQILIGGKKVKKTFLSMVKPHSIYLVTGTPLNNKREDLYALLKTMDSTIWHWNGFRNRYTVTEEGARWEHRYNPETKKVESKKRTFLTIVGPKNEDELKKKLDLYMIRRTKDEILPELSTKYPKIFHPRVMIKFDDEERKIYDDLREQWKAELRGRKVEIKSHLEWMTRAQQICNSLETYPESLGMKKSSKLKWLLDYVDNNAKDKKIVIFSKFEAMTSIIDRELRVWNPLHFHGGVPDKDRFKMWHDKFQKDPKHRIFVATYGAGSVAITLTAATDCILYDRPWTLKDFDQASNRIHRRGLTHPVNVIQPCIEDSFDEHIDRVWMEKGRMVEDMIGVDSAVKNMLLAEKEALI